MPVLLWTRTVRSQPSCCMLITSSSCAYYILLAHPVTIVASTNYKPEFKP